MKNSAQESRPEELNEDPVERKKFLDQQQQDVMTMLNLRSELRNQKIDVLVQWHENKNYKEILFDTPAEMENENSIMDWAWDHHSQQASSKISTIVHQMKRGLGRLRTLKASVFDAMEKARLATELERIVQSLEERLDALQKEKDEQMEALNMFRLHMKEKDNMLTHTLKREETGMKKVNDLRQSMKHVHDRRDQTIRDLLNIAQYKHIPVADIMTMYTNIRDTYDKKEPQLLEESMNDFEQLKMRSNEIHQQLMIDILKLHQTQEEDMELVKMILDTDMNRPDNQIRKWVRKKLKERKKNDQIKQKEEQRKLIMEARKKRLATKSSTNLLRTDSKMSLQVSEQQQAQQTIAQLEEEKIRMEGEHQEALEEVEERLRKTRSNLIESQQYIHDLKDQLKTLKAKPTKRNSTKNVLNHANSVKSLDRLQSEKKALLMEMKKMEAEKKNMEKKMQHELSRKEKENQKLLKSSLKQETLSKKERKKSANNVSSKTPGQSHTKNNDRSDKKNNTSHDKKKQKQKSVKDGKKDKLSLSGNTNADNASSTPPTSRKRRKTDDEFYKLIEEEKQKIREEHKRQLEAYVPGPEGEVVLVFVDIRHSSKLWRANLDAMSHAVQIFHNTVRTRLQMHSGYEFHSNENDSFGCAFATVKDAIDFSLYLQLELLEEDWPEDLLTLPEACVVTGASEHELLFRGLRVRIGLHLGNPVSEMNQTTKRTQYLGLDVKLAESVMRIADGGEICLSSGLWKHMEKHDLSSHYACPASAKYRGRIHLNGTAERELEDIRSILPAELAHREFDRDSAKKSHMANSKTIDNIVHERMKPVIKSSKLAIDAALTVEDESKSKELVSLIERIQTSANHVLKKKQLEHSAEISSKCNAALMEVYDLRRISIDVRRNLRLYGDQFGTLGREFEVLLESVVESQQERNQLAQERQQQLHSIKEERVSHLDSIKKTTNSHVQQLSELIQSIDDEIQMSRDSHGDASNGPHPSEEKLRAVRQQIIHNHALLKNQEKRLDELREQEENAIPPQEQLESLINERVEIKMSAFLARQQELKETELARSSNETAAEREDESEEEREIPLQGDEEKTAGEKSERSSFGSETIRKRRQQLRASPETMSIASDTLGDATSNKESSQKKRKKVSKANVINTTDALPSREKRTRKKKYHSRQHPGESAHSEPVTKTKQSHRQKRTKKQNASISDAPHSSPPSHTDNDSFIDEVGSIQDTTSEIDDSELDHESDVEDMMNEDETSIDENLDFKEEASEPHHPTPLVTKSKQRKARKPSTKSTTVESQNATTKTEAGATTKKKSVPTKNATIPSKKRSSARNQHTNDAVSANSSTITEDDAQDRNLSEDDNVEVSLPLRAAQHVNVSISSQDSSATVLRVHAYKKEIERLRNALIKISRQSNETGSVLAPKVKGAFDDALEVSGVEWNSPTFDSTIPDLHSISVQTSNNDPSHLSAREAAGMGKSFSADALTSVAYTTPRNNSHDPRKQSTTSSAHPAPDNHLPPSSPLGVNGSINGLSPHTTPKKHSPGKLYRGSQRFNPYPENNKAPEHHLSTDWTASPISSTKLKPRITPQPTTSAHDRMPHTLEALNTQRNSSTKQKVVYLSPLPKEEEAMQMHEKKRMNKKQKDLIKFSKKLTKREEELERRELELNLRIKEMQAKLRATTNQFYGIPTRTETNDTNTEKDTLIDEKEDVYYVPRFWNVFYPTVKVNPALKVKRKRNSLERTQDTQVRRSLSHTDVRGQYRVNKIVMDEDTNGAHERAQNKESAMRTVNASQWISKESIKNLSFKEFIGQMVQSDVRKYSLRINKGGRFLNRVLGGWTQSNRTRSKPQWR
mmetsp:Transcript_10634/g.39669  ORF Transcript_10634/g.39669 Transcript_10634/m.39669 type:complete len:1836 (-) Transcript_10634:622-6129(-)